MPKKKNVEVKHMMERLANPSIFDRIVQEVEANEIPAKYIQQVVVYYSDGKIVELSGEDISQPVPVNRKATWGDMEDSFRKITDVKIYINTAKLEKDVNYIMGRFLKRFFPE